MQMLQMCMKKQICMFSFGNWPFIRALIEPQTIGTTMIRDYALFDDKFEKGR